ncbi:MULTISPECIES: Fe(3+)-hydroxamate ABC transporter permease FhuB [unclassified Paludibacterium]|uniref:Fe(3+)-hydroxamate ABC transporter permease FhuB n=1 Tax=unclassified Paludibacterium TaxID=2618429 RepID=UPI001C056D49|nr:Fe(3+)-hydroxamate ABC transporter permease FhuB [Paludibacterium sp. B53371]BEV71814.1 Fe(3+)-hydroxamate ABC transporter permease FhuB [Paludibacterium sp. THUN1379]
MNALPHRALVGGLLLLAGFWPLWGGHGWQGSLAGHSEVDAILFWQGTVPRLCMALLCGAALGLSGMLLQQLSGNALVSPMTLGAASGAWLAMCSAAVWFPGWLTQYPDWLALGGAAAASLLLLAITGLRQLASLQLILAGMALNILLGALASAVTLLNDQYALGVFVWGAGDLAQFDWHWPRWLWPRLVPALLLLPWLWRPLQLLRLGQEAAAGRGLARVPVMLLVLLLSLWLCSLAVAAAGLIGFVSLLAPLLACRLGARGVAAQWLASALYGALLLLLADALAQAASLFLADSVPSGAMAALVGAPLLIWLLRDTRSLALGVGTAAPVRPHRWVARLGWFGLVVTVLLALGLDRQGAAWLLAWPDALQWMLRWPRMLAAASAGAGLAVAGVILQRLLRNPLASPDLLGVSSGSALAVVSWSLWSGSGLQQGSWLPAALGSALSLLALLWLGRRWRWAPGMLLLLGLALSALLDGLLQLMLARGDLNTVAVLGWLAGSTYRLDAGAALGLTLGVLSCLAAALLGQRTLLLLSLGDAMAAGRGLRVSQWRGAWFLLAAVLCALVTSLLGPVAFVGLLAPNLAQRLGARAVGAQLLGAALAGASLMLLADTLGRTLRYPAQLPVGLCAGMLAGGLMLLALLLRRGGRA